MALPFHSLLPLIVLILSFTNSSLSLQACRQEEYNALMLFKARMKDSYGILSSWVNGTDCCTWDAIDCSPHTRHIVSLNFTSYSFEGGVLSDSLCHLRFLTHLQLSSNQLTGTLPLCIGNLSHLQYLDLSNNFYLSGTIPPTIGLLTSLIYLDLSYNQLSGTLPSSLGSLSSLQHLSLSFNWLNGNIPEVLGNLSSLSHLDISSNQLNGNIPEFLDNLCSFSDLDISDNQLIGNIPKSLGNLSALSYLDISHNHLDDNIPESLGNLSSLSYLDISSNLLSGTLPSSIAKLFSLVSLFANNNKFNKTIPWEALPSSIESLSFSFNDNEIISETYFQNLTKLNHLSLYNCAISETFFHHLTKLEFLSLSNCALNISTTWIPSFQLRGLQMESCKMNGQIPLWISTQFLLESLTLANNNLSGEIPSWLWETCSSLQYIDLTANHLQGRLFTSFFPSKSMWMQLYFLDVSQNLLSGYLPSLWPPPISMLRLNDNLFIGNIPPSLGTLSWLFELNLANNHLNGIIPPSLGTLSWSSLSQLNLANNHLNGIIPPSLANCSKLEVLDLGNNSLKGHMPYEFGRLYNLKALVVRNNKLTGLFPPSITNCTNLLLLDIGDNSFKGQIPKSIGNLSLLKVLVMKGNKFTGSIPSEIGQLTELHILHVSSNNLSGFIPRNISSLQAMTIEKENGVVLSERLPYEGVYANSAYHEGLLMTAKGIDEQYPYIWSNMISIDLSNNKLEGKVPSDFGKSKGLMFLNLSMNYFNGCIPNSLGKMSQLESLDLSRNKFSGKIPGELDSLDYLGVLDLSNNNLSGSIPQGRKLNIFQESSYTGNPDLWGCPLPKNCSWPQLAPPLPPPANKKRKSTEILWYDITVGLVYGVSFGITTTLILVWKQNYFEKVDVVLKFFLPRLKEWTL